MMQQRPCLVVCDAAGAVVEVPGLVRASSAFGVPAVPETRSLIPVPQSSLLLIMPSRFPVGFDPATGFFVEVREYGGRPVFAAAAFLPPGYMCTGHPAYGEGAGARRLPLFCYAAVGWKNGGFYAAGYRIDRRPRHEIADAALGAIDRRARGMRAAHRGNRLVRHLVDNCVLSYRCPNACNLVLGKWECPVPVSRACNADCLGCISHQHPASLVSSTQHRIAFTPTVPEILDYAVPHLRWASAPIVSFGQGCEGEPLLEAGLIEEAIRAIRKRTRRGVVNLNTNASLPGAVERLCTAGLNSMRVSLNSAQPVFYKAYYRPKTYDFADVCDSIRVAKRHRVWVSLNYLVFPGFTDRSDEVGALRTLVKKYGVDMIQTRNLNIDPAWYAGKLGLRTGTTESSGMMEWVSAMRRNCPEVMLGYFNPTADMVARKSGAISRKKI